jgi:hypothetical protein
MKPQDVGRILRCLDELWEAELNHDAPDNYLRRLLDEIRRQQSAERKEKEQQ